MGRKPTVSDEAIAEVCSVLLKHGVTPGVRLLREMVPASSDRLDAVVKSLGNGTVPENPVEQQTEEAETDGSSLKALMADLDTLQQTLVRVKDYVLTAERVAHEAAESEMARTIATLMAGLALTSGTGRTGGELAPGGGGPAEMVQRLAAAEAALRENAVEKAGLLADFARLQAERDRAEAQRDAERQRCENLHGQILATMERAVRAETQLAMRGTRTATNPDPEGRQSASAQTDAGNDAWATVITPDGMSTDPMTNKETALAANLGDKPDAVSSPCPPVQTPGGDPDPADVMWANILDSRRVKGPARTRSTDDKWSALVDNVHSGEANNAGIARRSNTS